MRLQAEVTDWEVPSFPLQHCTLTDWNGVLDRGGGAVAGRISSRHGELEHLTHSLIVLGKCEPRCRDVARSTRE